MPTGSGGGGSYGPSKLGSGPYGGSQSAISLNIPISRFGQSNGVPRLALAGRYSVSHSASRDREWAAGLRWRPLARLPATIQVERRFRHNESGAVAAFVAGGFNGTRLPIGFVADGYGQAGVVTGNGSGPFGDFQMHAHKPLIGSGRVSLWSGVGLWAGGQDRSMRLDIGPSIRASFSEGDATVSVDASWRFRTAGSAEPRNGPTVTLSTSF